MKLSISQLEIIHRETQKPCEENSIENENFCLFSRRVWGEKPFYTLKVRIRILLKKNFVLSSSPLKPPTKDFLIESTEILIELFHQPKM